MLVLGHRLPIVLRGRLVVGRRRWWVVDGFDPADLDGALVRGLVEELDRRLGAHLAWSTRPSGLSDLMERLPGAMAGTDVELSQTTAAQILELVATRPPTTSLVIALAELCCTRLARSSTAVTEAWDLAADRLQRQGFELAGGLGDAAEAVRLVWTWRGQPTELSRAAPAAGWQLLTRRRRNRQG